MAEPQSHPLADVLPPMTPAEYAELCDSIRVNGQREPITLHSDGRILDGRHRARACAELGIPVATRAFDGRDTEALAYVLDLNLARRHLNESQRAMIAAELATLRQGARTDLASIEAMSQAEAAERLNVSRSGVQRAALVRDKAIPEIVAAVRQGHMPVSVAARVAELPEPRQQEVAAGMHNGKSLWTTVLGATRRERVAVIERAARHVPLSALGRTFPVLYADPPWQFQSWLVGGQHKAPEMHYPTMSLAEIAALPVATIAARDSVLFLWAVPALFPEALDVVKAWGFTFKTFATWIKPSIACGHWFRGKFDPLIVATRGSMPPPAAELHPSIFEDAAGPVFVEGEPRGPRRHSEKPDMVRDWIAAAYPDAGRIELFARSTAPGWIAWGNEA